MNTNTNVLSKILANKIQKSVFQNKNQQDHVSFIPNKKQWLNLPRPMHLILDTNGLKYRSFGIVSVDTEKASPIFVKELSHSFF